MICNLQLSDLIFLAGELNDELYSRERLRECSCCITGDRTKIMVIL